MAVTGILLALGAAGAAEGDGAPPWMACRERRVALSLAEVATGPVPELPRTDAPPDLPQGLPFPRLVVDAAGARTLDGAPVEALPARMGQVLLLVDHRLDAAGSARLLDDLAAADATPLVVRLSSSPAAEDVQDPALWPDHAERAMDEALWTKHLGRCGPGRALLEAGAPCDTMRARWRAASENWRCDLSDSVVEILSGPLAAPVADPVSILLLRLDPTADPARWYQGVHTWARITGDVHRITASDLPADGAEIEVASGELTVVKRVNPEYPRGQGDAVVRCAARVRVGRDGVPVEASVTGCPAAFQEATRKAMLAWRWAPPFEGRATVVTVVAVNFRRG